MECTIPSRDVIPAVAARLKYYVDVERKEVGFDLSLNPRDANEKYKLYEAGSHTLHHNQRLKNHFLEKQMEATIRHHIGKSGTDIKDTTETKHERRKQVQRKIKKNMSALVMPDRFSNNCVYPSCINQKLCDLEGFSSILSLNHPPDISHGEFKRLLSSAADLIVATTPGCPLPHLHQHKEHGVNVGTEQSSPSTCLKIPTCRQEPSPLKEESQVHSVASQNKNIDYEIIVHIGDISPTEVNPSLFMILIGDEGKSKTLLIQNTLYNGNSSGTGHVVASCVKAKDVGELKQILLGVNGRKQDCRCYCTNIVVLKRKRKYIFPCNKWLSHQIAMVCAKECHPLDNHSEAKDTEIHQTQIKTSKPSADSSNALDHNNNPYLVTSKMVNLNSRESSGEVKKGKAEIVVYKTNSAKKVSKKGKAKKGFQISKLDGSSERFTNIASKRAVAKRHASSGTKLRDVPPPKEETSVNHRREDQGESDQTPMLEDKHFSNITEHNDVAEPVFDNITTNTMTDEKENAYGDLQEQKIANSKLEHTRASSPANFVFFSHESQEFPSLDEVHIHGGKKTDCSMNPNAKLAQGMKEQAECSSADNNKDDDEVGASQLYFLQQILLESEDNLKDSSPRSKFQPSTDYLENTEKIEHQQEKSNQSNEVHSAHGRTGGHDVHDSGFLCSSEDCYFSDSTLNEDYLFSASSLALSSSEDEECEICSKCTKLEKDTKKCPQQMIQSTNNYRIHKERRVDSRNENSNVFQRSLAAIHSSDVNSLRNICQSHFFLPSIKDKEGKTLLHHAAARENPHIGQVLLDTTVGKVNIDQQDTFNKTALHYAVQNGNTKMIKLLLDRGAKIEILDEGSKTILNIDLKIPAN